MRFERSYLIIDSVVHQPAGSSSSTKPSTHGRGYGRQQLEVARTCIEDEVLTLKGKVLPIA